MVATEGKESAQLSRVSQAVRNVQQLQLETHARTFVREKKYIEALILLSNAAPRSGNIVTLIEIATADQHGFRRQAYDLLNNMIQRTETFGVLMNALRYVEKQGQKPLPQPIAARLRSRMRIVDPSWNGSVDWGAGEATQQIKLLSRQPIDSIVDQEALLDLAAMSKPHEKKRYIDRYLKLGGTEASEKYLKIRLLNVMHGHEISGDVDRWIGTLTWLMHPATFKSWVRKNSKNAGTPRWFSIPGARTLHSKR